MSQNIASNDDEKWDIAMFTTEIIEQPSEVEDAVSALGLYREKLVEVVLKADLQRALCTSHHPKGHQLIVMNAEVARGLRDAFCSEEWEFYEKNNQHGIINKNSRVIVIPCNLDENCGNPSMKTTNLVPKGAASKKNVECNQTGWLFGEEDYFSGEETGELSIWVLGSYYCKHRNKLFAELSCPTVFTNSQIKQFKHRIMLLDENGADLEIVKQNLQDDGPTEFVEIPVSRK